MLVSDFIKKLREHTYEHLFDDECYRRLDNVNRQFGHLVSHYVIWEAILSDEAKTVDCSILCPYDTPYGKNFGYEMDYETCQTEHITPSCGVNISKVKDMKEMFYAARKILTRMIPKDVIIALWPQIEKVSSMTFAWHGSVSDIAYMKGRGSDTRLKVFLQYLTPEAVVSILKDLGWNGDLSALERLLNEYICYCKAERLMIDFSIDPHGISSKVNVCISLKDQHTETVAAFLSHLIDNGLCLPEKAIDIMEFIEAGSSHIQNRITQFKLPFVGDKAVMAKVYLGQRAF